MDINAIYKKYGITQFDPRSVQLDLESPTIKAKPNTTRTYGEALSDTALQLGKGSGVLVRTIGDIAQLIDGTPEQTYLQKLGQDAIDFYDPKISAALKAKEEAARSAIKQQNGELAQGFEAIKQYGTSPALLSGVIAESLPSMIIGGAGGKAAGAGARFLGAGAKGVTRASLGGAIATESMLEGGSAGGEVLRKLTGRSDLSDPEKMNRARSAALATGAASAATYVIPGSRTIESALMGIGNGVASRGANALKGFAGEAGQEALQGGSSQMSQNYYTDTPIMQGVGEQVGIGTLAGGIPGGVMGGAVGAAGSRFASDRVASTVSDHVASHEANLAGLMENDLMKTPGGETFDPATDIGFKRESPSPVDHPADTLPQIDHTAVYGQVMGEMLDSARAENANVYAQAMAMAQAGAKPDQLRSFVDNAFTPTRDDLAIDDLVNGGEPMPSRLSGMRIVDALDRTIAQAISDPMNARTNEQLRASLKKEGVGAELANVYVKAYSAKDPTILTDHILAKTQPIAEDIRAQIDEHLSGYMEQAQAQKAKAWSDAVPESAQDLVNHPKFSEHLSERENVAASDARYSQVRTADLALSHENNGAGYETTVQQPAMYDRNYAYDFEMTKKDVADVRAGRWSDELVQKLRNDLDRRDNDPVYNPEKMNETPSQTLYRQMSEAMGQEHADTGMALIDARARAMGVTPDELIASRGISVENMREIDGADYMRNESSVYLFQKSDSEIKQEVDAAIQRALTDRNSDGHVEFGTLSDHAVEFIKKHTGLILKDYKIVLPDHAIRHMEVDHAVDIQLLAEMMSVVRDFDYVRKSIVPNKSTKRPETFIEFYKKVDDGIIKSVKFRDYGNKELSVKTFYKIDKIEREDQRLPKDLRLSPQYEKNSRPAGSTSKTDSDGFDGNKVSDTEILHQSGTDVNTPLKTLSDTAILKDMMDINKAVREGKIGATTDRNRDGWVSQVEIDAAGTAARNATPFTDNGKRVYEYRNEHGDTLRLETDGESVSIRSDRNAGEGTESVSYDYAPQNEAAKRLHQKIPDIKLSDSVINGMAELGFRDGEQVSTIYLFKSADASTLPHELMHVFERTFSDVERAAVDDILKNHPEGKARSEALARMFEKYLAEGEAPTPELRGVFERFRDWMAKLWETIAHDKDRGFELTDQHRELYRALLGDKEAAKRIADRYEGIVNERIHTSGGSDKATMYSGVDPDGNSIYRSFEDMRKELDDEANMIKMLEDCLL